MSLVDPFQRGITYLRLSVTDRCDFRCVYCMTEEMTFLPRADILSLEELAEIATAFTELGVKKIRITGGEPLVRRDITSLFHTLGRLPGLDELTLTTNGSQLRRLAPELKAAGVKRINISLDSLQPERFRDLTRTGDLNVVLDGIEAAREAGFERIKLNSVILKNRNADEVVDLVDFAVRKGLDISFIEEMPLGAVSEHDRAEEFCSSEEIRQRLSDQFTLVPVEEETGGPSRYWKIDNRHIESGSLESEKTLSGQAKTRSRIGFISPHSENFCTTCNRVRVTAEGRLLLCLGNEHSVDLKAILRSHPGDRERLKQAIVDAIAIKPERHHFSHDEEPQILRLMNATGG